ncbi:hypothetical protein HW555_008568 [Spodoptera exigua]|uniref:NTF2-related export protein n=1 Tax=Spodoptera exigua TaxID=7107 RepID=A0A835L4C2_SPOEX|nr:hypothetical protein HW555_008568 [Spodoptera exigua]
MTEAIVKNIDNACETAEEFTKVFYKQVDNNRHLTSKLYLDTGLLVWNGNGITGNDKIQKFLMDLPASNHVLKTLDAQPISENLVSNKLTYLIQACGDIFVLGKLITIVTKHTKIFKKLILEVVTKFLRSV